MRTEILADVILIAVSLVTVAVLFVLASRGRTMYDDDGAN